MRVVWPNSYGSEARGSRLCAHLSPPVPSGWTETGCVLIYRRGWHRGAGFRDVESL